MVAVTALRSPFSLLLDSLVASRSLDGSAGSPLPALALSSLLLFSSAFTFSLSALGVFSLPSRAGRSSFPGLSSLSFSRRLSAFVSGVLPAADLVDAAFQRLPKVQDFGVAGQDLCEHDENVPDMGVVSGLQAHRRVQKLGVFCWWTSSTKRAQYTASMEEKMQRGNRQSCRNFVMVSFFVDSLEAVQNPLDVLQLLLLLLLQFLLQGVVLDGLDLDLELVDLAVVGRMRHGQVVHGEGPEGGVELRADVVPDPGRMEGHYGLMHRSHHRLTRCHVLVDLLLLPVTLLCFLQLVNLMGVHWSRQEEGSVMGSVELVTKDVNGGNPLDVVLSAQVGGQKATKLHQRKTTPFRCWAMSKQRGRANSWSSSASFRRCDDFLVFLI
ncbi:hypothetical protein F7725_007084 [Dissostichus mawsoni]|uniref:Uncharacterized protein n=1 Tax=Dissostichus mawsoni TaxID=36200 RepID=A0A7J5XVU2_DISMA|nr:hypothetical protein F7725_007084 [Dissostichus mawsoni]